MNSLRTNNYKIKNTDTDYLEKLGFSYSRTYSTDETKKFIYEFPVYKNGSRNVLFGRIVVNTLNKEVTIDCFDDNGTTYAPFYQAEIKNNNVIVSVNKKITTKFKQFGIKKVG